MHVLAHKLFSYALCLALACALAPSFAWAAESAPEQGSSPAAVTAPAAASPDSESSAVEDEAEVQVFSLGGSAIEEADENSRSAPRLSPSPVKEKASSSASTPSDAAQKPTVASRIVRTFDEYGGVSAVMALAAAFALLGIGISLHRVRID